MNPFFISLILITMFVSVVLSGLNVLIVAASWNGAGPNTLREAVRTTRGSIVVHKSGTTLHCEVVPGIVMKLEGGDESVWWIAGVRTLGFTERRWMRPKSRFCTHYAGFAYQ